MLCVAMWNLEPGQQIEKSSLLLRCSLRITATTSSCLILFVAGAYIGKQTSHRLLSDRLPLGDFAAAAVLEKQVEKLCKATATLLLIIKTSAPVSDSVILLQK